MEGRGSNSSSSSNNTSKLWENVKKSDFIVDNKQRHFDGKLNCGILNFKHEKQI